MGLAMSDVAAADAGVASGLINTTQQVGAAMGTAVLASVAASRTASLGSVDHREALAAGFRLAYGVSAGFLMAAVALGGLVLARRTRRSAVVTAEPEVCSPARRDRNADTRDWTVVTRDRRVDTAFPPCRPSSHAS